MHKLAKFFIITLLAVLASSCIDRASQLFLTGKAKIDATEYDLGVEDLKEAIALGAPKGEAAFYIAEGYRQSNRMTEAEEYYKIAIKSGYSDDRADYYYAEALKANGKYSSALKVFKRYIKIGGDYNLIDKAKKEIKSLSKLPALLRRPEVFEIENCTEINSKGLDYRPVIINDQFYYTSSRGEGLTFAGDGERFSDLYTYHFDGLSKYSGAPRDLGLLIDQEKTHEADPTFSPDGKTMIFSRSTTGKPKDITQEVDLFESTFYQGDWTEPKRLDFCESEAWDSNPWLSNSGDTLYFSSNREGGYGGDDIWMVFRNESNDWGTPVNLGPKVNTGGDEQFPYVDMNNNFYFSSDGHPGFGGLDIFQLKLKDGKRIVENYGRPVNSKADDFGLFLIAPDQGYFASNREGGLGSDDIYAFIYDCTIKYELQITVTHQELDADHKPTGKEFPISGASVTLMDLKGEILDLGTTSDSGFVTFHADPEKEYTFKAVADGHLLNDNGEHSTIGKTAGIDDIENCDVAIRFTNKIELTPIKDNLIIEFPPILYEYNKWDILPESEHILKAMAKTLLDNPAILVELGSHTDARGSLTYNDVLSQKRAESAVNWIIKNGGVDSKRIAAKGYGERVPRILKVDTAGFIAGSEMTEELINTFEKTDSAKFELGHQLNRRTEFTVVDVIKDTLNPSKIKVVQTEYQEQVFDENKEEHKDELIERYLGVDSDSLDIDYEQADLDSVRTTGTNQVEFDIDEDGIKTKVAPIDSVPKVEEPKMIFEDVEE